MFRNLIASLFGFALIASSAHAALIVGNTYQDSNALNWTYIGDYNVGNGPSWHMAMGSGLALTHLN
jgi:hypothetical protein